MFKHILRVNFNLLATHTYKANDYLKHVYANYLYVTWFVWNGVAISTVKEKWVGKEIKTYGCIDYIGFVKFRYPFKRQQH